jgi:hypothetical protein
MSALATETAANQTYNGEWSQITTDVNNQGQRISSDTATLNSDQYGAGCIGSVSITDPSSYTDCVSSEEQAAATARSDSEAAVSEVDQDYVKYGSVAGTYETALSVFIGEIVGLSWPSRYNEAVNAVVSTARTFRSDLANEAAIAPTTPSSAVSAINAQSGTDVGSFNDALNVLRAELGQAVS